MHWEGVLPKTNNSVTPVTKVQSGCLLGLTRPCDGNALALQEKQYGAPSGSMLFLVTLSDRRPCGAHI